MDHHKAHITVTKISMKKAGAHVIQRDLVHSLYMPNKMPFYMPPKMGLPSKDQPSMSRFHPVFLAHALFTA